MIKKLLALFLVLIISGCVTGKLTPQENDLLDKEKDRTEKEKELPRPNIPRGDIK